MRPYTRVIACLLLAWLPLQAAALPVMALTCHAGGAGPAVMHDQAAAMDTAAHDGHNAHQHRAAVADDSAPGVTADGGPAGHQCCTHFTAVTATVLAAAKALSAHAMATPPARAVSHLPEPPQQPPRPTPL